MTGEPISTAILAGATLLGSRSMSRGSSAPPAPVAPAVMPVQDDEAAKKARKKSIAGTMQQSGRLSTILTDTGTTDKLGG